MDEPKPNQHREYVYEQHKWLKVTEEAPQVEGVLRAPARLSEDRAGGKKNELGGGRER